MLSRDAVTLRLTYLATALRRKVDQRVLDIYHRELSRYLDEEQFGAACDLVLEDEEAKWPTIGRLVKLGKGHRRRERGVPHILDSSGESMGVVGDVFAALDRGESLPSSDVYRGEPNVAPMIERLVWEDAVVTTEVRPGDTLHQRLSRIAATAKSEMARLQAAAQPTPPPAETP